MIPRYLRPSESNSAWATNAYLHGAPESGVAPLRKAVFRDGAKKLNPVVLGLLKNAWTHEFNVWNQLDLSKVHFTCFFANGIYQEIRGDKLKFSVLVSTGRASSS